MLFSDILPGILSALAQRTAPVGGPVVPALPKAASNATAMYLPPVKVPYTDPAAMLNAIANANESSYRNKLLEQQAALTGLQAQLAQQRYGFAQQIPALASSLFGSLSGPAGGAGTAPSDTTAPSAVAPIPGVSTGAAKPPGALASALAAPAAPGSGNPGYLPYSHKSGTDYLNGLAQISVESALGPGYSVKMTSGERPGARVAGTGGVSQHALGNAADFQIVAPDGTPIPNTGPDSTGAYGKLALEMRARLDPRLVPFLGWGGNFTTGPENGPRDLMHFDLGGDRGRFGTLAAEAAANTKLAQATPTTMTDVPTSNIAAPQAPPLSLVPGGAGGTGMDPRVLLQLGFLSNAAGFGDIAKPFLTFYYNSPAYKAQLAGAEAAGKLPYVGPTAAAEAAGKFPYDLALKWNSPVSLRAQGTLVNPATGQMVAAAPSLQKVVDPQTGQETYRYFSPMAANTPGQPTAPQGIGAAPPSTAAPVAALGPGQEKGHNVRAEEEQKQRQRVIDEANAAQQTRATLMNMSAEVGNFTLGPFAAHAQTALRYLRLIDPSYNGQVASYEDFIKNAGALTRSAVREVSSRAAVQEFTMIQNTLPNPEMSPQGLRRVQNELIGLSDNKIAKAQAQQQWEQQHGGIGNVSGFETAFQKQASPYAFIVARMDPEDRQAMIAKLQTSEEGRHELARLRDQLTYIKQARLAP